MKIIQVPVLQDNVSYLVIDETSNNAAFVVDPAEPQKVLHAAKQEQANIVAVLTTHHHHDHSGGNKGITEEIAGLEVYGGDDRIPALTKKVKDETFNVGNLKVKVFFTPCHTSGHVLYLVESHDDRAPKALFTGDTLFIGGCGRFFEGTAQGMYHALLEVIDSLPPNTEIYCGHEYTKKNLEFAHKIEPGNAHVTEKLQWATQQREKGLSTIPSTIEEERLYNPFFRVREASIAEAVGKKGADPIEVMAAVRAAKDVF